MDQRSAYTWDRACGVRYPLSRVVPPDRGDKMLAAMVTADAEIRAGGFPRLFETFDERLDLAAEGFRYFGLTEIADALTSLAAGRRRYGAFPDRLDIVGSVGMVARAFRHCGVPGTGDRSVDELLALAARHYLDEISPTLEEHFAAYFADNREDFAPPGHPSTWG